MARNLGFGASASERDPQHGTRPGTVYRLCIRQRPRAPDDAALWRAGPAPVLRKRSAFPRAICLTYVAHVAASSCPDGYVQTQTRLMSNLISKLDTHAIPGILA